MEKYSFSELLAYQVSNTKIVNSENELSIILDIKNNQNFPTNRRMSSAWLKAIKSTHQRNASSVQHAIQSAIRLREEGNNYYNSKSGSKFDNMINAAQRYTQAIFTAIENTESLALAYANRAMALQELEYYQQAYDDCVCALETNHYPVKLLHKIKIRQAFCAYYLKDSEKLKKHLEELEKSTLNENFSQRVKELQKGLKILDEDTKIKTEETINTVLKLKESTVVRIDTKVATRGRYMIAKNAIKSGEVIFNERISSFVPVEGCQICQQCGAMLMIPIPCHDCNCSIIYCSLKCRRNHKSVHQNECTGYLCRLFEQIGISHLALRVVLEDFPAILPIVSYETDIYKLWQTLITPDSSLYTKTDVNYVQTLQMVTHMQKMSLPNKLWFALVADFLVVYLKDYTNFFAISNKTKLKQCDWESIVSALIFRHIGQFIVNAHTCSSISPTCYDVTSTTNRFGILLVPHIWTKPLHLKRGMLHSFSETKEVSAANLPYLSMCNHACGPTLCPKFSGRNFYALADSNIEKGAEILNCYTVNYKNSLRNIRRAYLKEIYHFNCTCTYCQKPDPDKSYLKYHVYKCRNPTCGEKFVPTDKQDVSPALHWWQLENGGVSCTICSEEQSVEWFMNFTELLENTNNAQTRLELFRIYDMVDSFLVDFHSLKMEMGNDLMKMLIKSYNAGVIFNTFELNKLVSILNFCQRATIERWGLQSIEYVTKMSVLWDFIAVGLYQSTQLELKTMLKALDVISDEYKQVFLNYYNDYLQNK
ncbi:SET and MYND domain-containing protein 4 isoform X1 [Bactrocera neohumeralis]|uniref:SET and MYND domain-containing protein 4 isoform X1 n=2 Tax=Bactrocera neohumeralis TaxID=98809 RepID=UPI002166A9B9|nr:SET and MYND domain-containing protein 4 isoform X1 [Bactrocera neohumeralis]